MAETGVEGEELHQTHRNQSTKPKHTQHQRTQRTRHNNYKLKPPIAEMLRKYLLKIPKTTHFQDPKQCKNVGTARNKASKVHNDPQLKKIPMKSLRNYSGAQVYFKSAKCPIAVKRHLRHKKLETTMHYYTSNRPRRRPRIRHTNSPNQRRHRTTTTTQDTTTYNQ